MSQKVSVIGFQSPDYVNEYYHVHPFYVVWKGMDEVHGPDKQKRTFRHRGKDVKGSIVIEKMIKSFVDTAVSAWSADEFLVRLNSRIQGIQIHFRISIKNTSELCGARVVVARDMGDYYSIAYIGDCFALVAYKDGRVEITENQSFLYDFCRYEEINQIWHDTANEIEGTTLELTTEMWRRFMPVLVDARNAHINNPASPHGYGIANGQPQMKDLILTCQIPKEGLSYLMLGNSGLTPFSLQKKYSRGKIGSILHKAYKKGGPQALINTVRDIERKTPITHMRSGHADLAGLVLLHNDELESHLSIPLCYYANHF